MFPGPLCRSVYMQIQHCYLQMFQHIHKNGEPKPIWIKIKMENPLFQRSVTAVLLSTYFMKIDSSEL